MPYLDQFLSVIVDQGGSDLHIGEGQPPKTAALENLTADYADLNG